MNALTAAIRTPSPAPGEGSRAQRGGWGRLAPLALLAVMASGCAPAAQSRLATATAEARSTGEALASPVPRPTADRDVERVVTADGAMALPVPPQALSFPASGTILEVAVTEGEDVRAGQILARMDLLAFDLAVADAEAGLATARDALDKALAGATASERASARAEVAGAEAALAKLESAADLESARLEVERAKNNLWGTQAQRDSTCGAAERGLATQASCDQAQAAVQAAEQGVEIAAQARAAAEAARPGDLAAARARVAAARAALARLQEGSTASQLEAAQARVAEAEGLVAQARANRQAATMTAPFDGTVTAVSVAEGVRAGPGAPIVTVAKTRPLTFVTTNLSERNVGDVREGARATVTLTAYPDRPLSATVARVGAEATADAGGAVVFAVSLVVEDDGLPLRAGMTGRVEIEVRAHRQSAAARRAAG